MGRVMIVANDVVASQMAGPGIRCVELARQLVRAGGHQVTLVTVGPTDLTLEGVELVADPSPEAVLARAATHDAVLLEGISLARYPDLRRVRVPLIFDLYDPFPLALLEQEAHRPLAEQRREGGEVRRVLREMLLAGDFFLCASQIQRDLWTGALLDVGRVNPDNWARDNSLRQLVDIVPFGLPSDPPPPREGKRTLGGTTFEEQDLVLVWAGGIYNWFDPLTLIEAMHLAAEPRVKLVFMSTSHPNPSVPGRMWMPLRARELADRLQLTGSSVFFNEEWVPYADRGRWLRAADAGVSTHLDHAETRYAYRTRMLDYLWAGLPMICTSGDHFAGVVRERELGWVVEPQDAAGLAAAIHEFADGPQERSQISERVRQVAAEMTWERVSRPLLDFCERPRRAADLPRQEWIRRRPPTPLELRTREAGRLARRAARELVRSGPAETSRRAVRWWRSRRGSPPRA